MSVTLNVASTRMFKIKKKIVEQNGLKGVRSRLTEGYSLFVRCAPEHEEEILE
jgi:hypothetical protein